MHAESLWSKRLHQSLAILPDFPQSQKTGLACENPSSSPSFILWNPTVGMWPAYLLHASFSSVQLPSSLLKASSYTFIVQMSKVAQEETPLDTDPRSVVQWAPEPQVGMPHPYPSICHDIL